MLIVLEGIDGSGKETHAEMLATRLKQDGHQVNVFSFPVYASPTGDLIKRILHGLKYPMEAFQLLYAANRLEQKTNIEDYIRRGFIVICDRYTFSSLCYGMAQGQSEAWLRSLDQHMPPADLAILVRVSPEIAFARMSMKRDVNESDLALLHHAASNYIWEWQQYPWRNIIDGERPANEIADDIYERVNQFAKEVGWW